MTETEAAPDAHPSPSDALDAKLQRLDALDFKAARLGDEVRALNDRRFEALEKKKYHQQLLARFVERVKQDAVKHPNLDAEQQRLERLETEAARDFANLDALLSKLAPRAAAARDLAMHCCSWLAGQGARFNMKPGSFQLPKSSAATYIGADSAPDMAPIIGPPQ